MAKCRGRHELFIFIHDGVSADAIAEHTQYARAISPPNFWACAGFAFRGRSPATASITSFIILMPLRYGLPGYAVNMRLV